MQLQVTRNVINSNGDWYAEVFEETAVAAALGNSQGLLEIMHYTDGIKWIRLFITDSRCSVTGLNTSRGDFAAC